MFKEDLAKTRLLFHTMYNQSSRQDSCSSLANVNQPCKTAAAQCKQYDWPVALSVFAGGTMPPTTDSIRTGALSQIGRLLPKGRASNSYN